MKAVQRFFFSIFLMALVAAVPAPAGAVFMTGDELARSCRGDTPKDLYLCVGYISGIIDYHVLMQSLGTAPTIDFCLPPGTKIEDAAAAVIDYLDKVPEGNAFVAAPSVTLALNKLYPCVKLPKKNPRKKR